MDRSLSYTNGAWSVPNLRPTRAQTAASAYRPPRISTNSFERRPRTQSAAANAAHSPNRLDSNQMEKMQESVSRNSTAKHGQSFQSHQRRRSPSSRGVTPHSSFSSADDRGLSEENDFLREKVRDLERSLLKSQQQQDRMQKMAALRHARSHVIKVTDEIPSFDPASNTLPISFGIVEPNEVFRPNQAPRPLSPIRQFKKIEGLAASPISSISENRKKQSRWSLGREFQPKEVESFEVNKHLLAEWLSSFNNEQMTYRSLSTQLETELHEAQVFSRQLPAPNMLTTAVACASLGKLGTLFGRYKELFGSIRRLLIQAVFADADNILGEEEGSGTLSTVEQFCAHEPYFSALNRHQIQLAEMKSNFEGLRESLTEHKGAAKKRRGTMVAEMWKNAAVKSSAKMIHANLSKQLKQAEDSLSTLHNSIHIDTHNSIIKLLDKLNPNEASSVLSSLLPLIDSKEFIAVVVEATRNRKKFSSSQVLSLIMGLTTVSLDKPETIALFPSAGKLLSNSTVHVGVLRLLNAMSAKNRDALMGELYSGDTAGILSLLRQVTGLAGGSALELLSHLAQMTLGDDPEQHLKLCASLMSHATNAASGSGSSNNSGAVMKQLFEHLPSELEHAIHEGAHERRQQTGVVLKHEAEAAVAEQKREEKNAEDLAAGRGPRGDGVTIETQTEDPNGLFGTLDADKIWSGNMPGEAASDGQASGDGHVPVELAHWYEDLMKLGMKSRYQNITPMNFSKALTLVYDTYVRKIVKNIVDDRNHHLRESMGSFLKNSFKKLYGIPRVVNENLVGVVQSIELFASRSRRVRIFGELCGRQQKEHISDRLSDVYLHMLTLAWPKFSKHVLRSHKEGQCFINSTQIRKVMMGIFPKRHKVGKKTRPGKKIPTDIYVGQILLVAEVREEMYETVARTVFEKKGVTYVDFDVYSQIVLESWKRQQGINCEMFDIIFANYCDKHIERERRESVLDDENLQLATAGATDASGNAQKKGVAALLAGAKGAGSAGFGGINLSQAAASAKARSEAEAATAAAAAKAAEDDKEQVMSREAMELAVTHIIPLTVTKELLDQYWNYLEPHRMTLGDPTHITKDHFSLMLTHHGIMPPADSFFAFHQENEIFNLDNEETEDVADGDAAYAAAAAVGEKIAGGENVKARRDGLHQLFGAMNIAAKLKKIARKVKTDLVELPYFSLMCQTGDAEKVKEALDSANVDEANDRGSTPLMHATWYGHIEVIKHLINAGANINYQNKRGNTALHFAYENSHHSIIDVRTFVVVGGGGVVMLFIGFSFSFLLFSFFFLHFFCGSFVFSTNSC